jgi:hypothetical protein
MLVLLPMSSYICKRKSDDDGVLGTGHWGYIYIYI